MIEQEMAERNLLFKIKSGSYLYGTNIEGKSDEDYLGVFIPDQDYVLGTKRCEQVEMKTNPSDSKRANNKEDVDSTIYSLIKFIHLAEQNNPTLLETFFAPDNCLVRDTELGKLLRNAYPLFVSKKSKHTYLGYSFSQKMKVMNKKERYSKFIQAYDQVKQWIEKGHEKLPQRLTLNTNLIEAGSWRAFEKGQDIIKTKEAIKNEIEKYGTRLEGIKQFDFDPKFLSHVVRLVDEGLEILNTGRLQFPLKNVEYIKEVKAGKHELGHVLEYVDEKEKLIEEAGKNSKLPDTADHQAINDLQIKILKEFWHTL